MKKKILIFGGTGLLGTNLVYNLQNKFEIILNFHNKKFFSKHIKYTKVINPKNIDIKEIEKKIKTLNPKIIINCAANTDLEYCEKRPQDTEFPNSILPEILPSNRIQTHKKATTYAHSPSNNQN